MKRLFISLVLIMSLLLGSVFVLNPEAQAATPVWGGGNVTLLGHIGSNTRCAVANGQPACWGYNYQGALGNGTTRTAFYSTEVDTSGVLNGKSITKLSHGSSSVCAVASGEAICWGSNFDGQLGNNSTDNSLVPVAVDTSGVLNGKTVTDISGAASHTCAIADSSVYCWGLNDKGQLGNNSTDNSLVPVAVDTSGVLNGKTVTDISANWNTTCVIADGEMFCWGANDDGQLGNNSTDNSLVPVAVDTSGVLNGKTITSISVHGTQGTILDGVACAVADGQVYCWGSNEYGQLGNNSTDNSLVPVAVDTSGVLNGKTVVSVSLGGRYSCALAASQAFCWGYNDEGQLGNGSTSASLVPMAVDTTGVLNGKTVMQVEAGNGHGGCVLAEGAVYCWGSNQFGSIGDGTFEMRTSPVAVLELVPEIKNISFSDEGSDRVLTITGDWDFTHYSDAVLPPTAPLVEMNGSVVPFCTNSLLTSEALTDGGIDPSYFSDDPMCYLLIDESYNSLMTNKQVKILLPEGFDETAELTLRVSDAGPTTLSAGSDEPFVTAKVEGKALTGTPKIPKRPTFSGTTVPLSEVTVTVNSDPVICTTTADSSGNWSCTLPSDLEPGQHQVTVQVTTPDSQVVTIGPYAVQVLGESTTIGGNLADTGFSVIIPSAIAFVFIGLALRRTRVKKYKLN